MVSSLAYFEHGMVHQMVENYRVHRGASLCYIEIEILKLGDTKKEWGLGFPI